MSFERYTDRKTYAKIVDYPSVCAMWQARAAEYGEAVALEDGGEQYICGKLKRATASAFWRRTGTSSSKPTSPP